jgi:hypothetical protein
MTVYIYTWRNNEKRRYLAGRTCLVLARDDRRRRGSIPGGTNSALVEFENGDREVVSRNALQRFDRLRAKALKDKGDR